MIISFAQQQLNKLAKVLNTSYYVLVTFGWIRIEENDTLNWYEYQAPFY